MLEEGIASKEWVWMEELIESSKEGVASVWIKSHGWNERGFVVAIAIEMMFVWTMLKIMRRSGMVQSFSFLSCHECITIRIGRPVLDKNPLYFQTRTTSTSTL